MKLYNIRKQRAAELIIEAINNLDVGLQRDQPKVKSINIDFVVNYIRESVKLRCNLVVGTEIDDYFLPIYTKERQVLGHLRLGRVEELINECFDKLIKTSEPYYMADVQVIDVFIRVNFEAYKKLERRIAIGYNPSDYVCNTAICYIEK